MISTSAVHLELLPSSFDKNSPTIFIAFSRPLAPLLIGPTLDTTLLIASSALFLICSSSSPFAIAIFAAFVAASSAASLILGSLILSAIT